MGTTLYTLWVEHHITPSRGDGGRVSLVTHAMGSATLNLLQQGVLQWYGQPQCPVENALPLFRYR